MFNPKSLFQHCPILAARTKETVINQHPIGEITVGHINLSDLFFGECHDDRVIAWAIKEPTEDDDCFDIFVGEYSSLADLQVPSCIDEFFDGEDSDYYTANNYAELRSEIIDHICNDQPWVSINDRDPIYSEAELRNVPLIDPYHLICCYLSEKQTKILDHINTVGRSVTLQDLTVVFGKYDAFDVISLCSLGLVSRITQTGEPTLYGTITEFDTPKLWRTLDKVRLNKRMHLDREHLKLLTILEKGDD